MADWLAQAVLVSLWLYAAAECCIGVCRHGRRVQRYRGFCAYVEARAIPSDVKVARMWLRDELTRFRFKALLVFLALVQCWVTIERALLPTRRVDLDGPQALSLVLFLLVLHCLMTWTRQADRDRAPELIRVAHTRAGLVYVVDDSAVMRRWIVRILEKAGHDVVAFASGGPALVALTSQRPDVLLLDVVLGAESGVALAQQVRARWPTLPIYLVTGHAADMTADEMADLVQQAGAQGWVTKPMRPGVLESVVAEALVRAEP